MRFTLIDLFRIIALVILLIYHIATEFGPQIIEPFFRIGNFYFMNLGNLAVTLFVIISGLILQLKYGQTKYKYLKFISRRLVRIYSTYIPCLLVGVIVYFSVPKYILSLGYYYIPFSGSHDIVCSILGFCNYILRAGGPFIATGWFIGLIVLLYAFFPLLSKKITRHNHTVIFIILFIIFILRIISSNIFPSLNRFFSAFPLFYIFEFSLGIYLANNIKRSFWSIIKNKTITKILSYTAALSFPLFLLHHPFLFMIKYLKSIGFNSFLAVIIYLITVITVANLILIITRKIPNKIQIQEKIDQNIVV